MRRYTPVAFSMKVLFFRLSSRDLEGRFETAFQDQLSCTLRSIG